ncbi:hypothetical protein HMPREF3027_06565 [Porphyromonas sp. HMSC077F02]|nr:hypothetical protein HMPREF3027_06565 [Porphyromonas sp. HMSC077F02]
MCENGTSCKHSLNGMVVHFFNPGYEASILRGVEHYTPPKMVRRLREDLQTLPIYYAGDEDKVLVTRRLPEELRHSRLTAHLPVGAELKPWGWGPELRGLFPSIELPYSSAVMAYFASRERGVELWHKVYKASPKSFRDAPPRKVVPPLALSPGRWVLKEDFTSSGRGIEMLDSSNVDITEVLQTKWVQTPPRSLFIEPYYEIVYELGFEYQRKNGAVAYLGYHRAITHKAQYIGSYLGEASLGVDIDAYAEWVRQSLQEMELYDYEGIIGVDTALYHWEDGSLHFVPCLEVNIRPTMGFVALSLAQRYLGNRGGRFVIARRDDPIIRRLTDSKPLYLYDDSTLVEGVYLLTPILDNTYFVAILEVGLKH